MSNRALEWLVPGDPSDRIGYCGATTWASLITARDGDPYFSGAGAWKVWVEQKHPELLAPPSAETRARWDLGHHLEPYICQRLARENPDVMLLGDGYVYAPEPHTFMRAQVDNVLAQAPSADDIIGPVDAKATELPWDWFGFEKGDDGWQKTEELSHGYTAQGQCQVGLMREQCKRHGLRLPTIATFAGLDLTKAPMVPTTDGGVRLDLDRAPLMVREVHHDEDRWRRDATYVIEWWHRFIIGDEEPPDDDSKACLAWRVHEACKGHGQRQATEEEYLLIQEWRTAKADLKAGEKNIATLKARILAAMDVPVLTCGGKARVQLQRSRNSAFPQDYGF